MPFIDHFKIHMPLMLDLTCNANERVAHASVAEMERAVRDPVCTHINLYARGFGYVPASKAAIRGKLVDMRKYRPGDYRIPVLVRTEENGTVTLYLGDNGAIETMEMARAEERAATSP